MALHTIMAENSNILPHLISVLLQRGENVRLISSAKHIYHHIEVIETDLHYYEDVRIAVQGSLYVYLLSNNTPTDLLTLKALTYNAINACKETFAKLIFLDDKHYSCDDHEANYHKKMYSYFKNRFKAIEDIIVLEIKQQKLNGAIVRCNNIYGCKPQQINPFIMKVFKRTWRIGNFLVFIAPNKHLSMAYAPDVAQVLYSVAKMRPTENVFFNVPIAQPPITGNYAADVLKKHHIRQHIIVVPTLFNGTLLNMFSNKFNNSRALGSTDNDILDCRSYFNEAYFTPTGYAQGLAHVSDYLREM